MKIVFEQDEVIIGRFLGKKIIKASEISKIIIRDGKVEIKYKDNWNTENYAYSFNPYQAIVPIFEFILNNNIEYEDEQESGSKLYDEESCKQIIDDFIVECKSYGDKLIKEKIGSEYELYIDRHDYKHRSFIQYWLLENGKKKEFPGDDEGENGEKIMDDLEMSFLVKNDVSAGRRYYGITLEVSDKKHMREYLDWSIDCYASRLCGRKI